MHPTLFARVAVCRMKRVKEANGGSNSEHPLLNAHTNV